MDGQAASRHHLLVPTASEPGAGAVPAVDVRDPAVPEIDEVLDGDLGAGSVVDGDRFDPRDAAADGRDRQSGGELLHLSRGESRPGQHDAVDAMTEEPVDSAPFE